MAMVSTKIDQIKALKNKLFEAAEQAGFSDYEIYYTGSTNFEVHILDQAIREYKNASPSGLSFRGLYDGKMGYVYTEKITDDVINFLVTSAKDNAMIKESTDESLFAGSPIYPQVDGISPKLGHPTANEKINWAKQLEVYAKEADPRVVAVDYCVVTDGTGEVYIANSHGLNLHQESGHAIAYVVVRIEENGSIKTDYKIWSGKDFSDFDPKSLAYEAVQTATQKLGASSIPTNDYAVLIKNKAVLSLLSAFISNFFAESVQKGLSLLKDKIDTQIATPLLTIRDNISHPNSLKKVPFDSEGVAIRDKTVIENGILKTYLYSIKSANKAGKDSTGNGFKGSFKSSVATDINNFFIEPGSSSFEELTQHFDGVLITNFQGLHAGTNSVSGDFSLQAEGFLYKAGQVVKPVEQITVAGNFYTLLNHIEALADDIYFSPMGGGIGSPTLLVSGLKISGE